MNIKRHCIIILSVLFLASVVDGGEHVRFGADSGWNNTVSVGLMETPGWKGTRALTLSPLGRNPFIGDGEDVEGDIPIKSIDLLLLADSHRVINPAGHYRISGEYSISSLFPARGETSIRFGNGGILLYPFESSMWAPGSEWGDFTLDFRLRPATLRNGEVLFSWRGRDEQGEIQRVTAQIEDRRIVWEFQNFFRQGNERSLDLELSSPPLVPGEWRHHRIRFKRTLANPGPSGSSLGLLEYLVGGIPADMVHATPTGREGVEPFSPRIGKSSSEPVHLAPAFSGYIDEFRLAGAFASRPPSGGYSDRESASSGIGRTHPVDTQYPGSSLSAVRARIGTPGSTRVRFYAYSAGAADDLHLMPDPGDPRWIELTMMEEAKDPIGFGRWYSWNLEKSIKGRYLAVGYILDPDPGADLAPVLSALELEYEPRLPPRPPRKLQRDLIDGELRVSWSPDAEEGVSGWWISWGPRPGDYVSTGPEDDKLHGTAWIGRNPEDGTSRPYYTWPDDVENRIIYTSVRSAWAEGGPSRGEPPRPGDYRALSEPTMEINFRP